MADKKFRYSAVIIAIMLLAVMGNAGKSDDPQPRNNTVYVQVDHEGSTILYPMRSEFVDSFERATLAPWATGGTAPWAIRDTLDNYGPQTCAISGYRFAGVPATDIAVYPGNQTDSLRTPTIDLTGWDSLFFSFSYWADLEGSATNFDGVIIQISSNNGTTWRQIDSTAVGHLNPTYDQHLVGTGQIGTPWAYCYDRQYWRAVSSMDLMGLGYVATGNQMIIRFVFDSDDLSGGQGFFVDDIRIADTSPPDLQAPIITHTPLPDTTDTLNDYTVTAAVTDGGSGVNGDSVILHYEIEGGATADVFMTPAGGNNYEADIPQQDWHTDIWYQILAADNAGNWAETPVLNFEVTSARTIIYDDGQPWYAPDTTYEGYFIRFDFQDVGIDTGLIHQLKILLEAPGTFDVRVYTATVGQPGTFIDSIAGIVSPGYDWFTVDLDPLNISTYNTWGIVVGYVETSGQIGVLRDATLDNVGKMWNLNTPSTWVSEAAGDFLMRLKVIPLDNVGIDENTSAALRTFALSQVAPSPMSSAGVIEFSIPTDQRVTLSVYNASGQLVRTLVNGTLESGNHRVVWDSHDDHGKQVASGVYFYTLQGISESVTKKLIVVR